MTRQTGAFAGLTSCSNWPFLPGRSARPTLWSWSGCRRIGPLSADNPEVLPFRAIQVLAELRMGRNEEALGRLEAAREDWSVQEPRWRAVHAAVLRANQLQDRARRAVAGLAAAQLRPPELALVGDLPALPAR